MVSVAVYVIGDSDGLRSPTLEQALASAPWPVRFVDPIFIRLETNPDLVDNDVAELIFGRSLTGGEVGCALAHRSAYAAAEAENVDVAVVFEDDAHVSLDMWDRLAPLLECERLAGPTILSLYAGDHGRGREERCGRETILRLRRPPTHAVAYLITRQALACALAAPEKVVSPADWPPWSTSVQFLLMDELVIAQSGASVIGDRPESVGAMRRMERLVRVVRPKAWRAGGPYFASTAAYLDWVVLAPAAKLSRRMTRSFRRIRHASRK